MFLKYIKKIVMGFSSGNLIVQGQQQDQQSSSPQQPNNELDLAQLEYLLKLVGNADFKGHQVEMVYNLITKLQNQYIQKSAN